MKEPFTKDENLKIGTILKAARARIGKTEHEIACMIGVNQRMVRLWERDIRNIGRGNGAERMEQVFLAYQLTQQEREEVVKRTSLRKHEFLEGHLSQLLTNSPPAEIRNDPQSEEMRVLIQLMALSPEKRQWVIQSANTHIALKGHLK